MKMAKSITPDSIKKIVIICPYLFELHRGVERYCLSLADALIRKGKKVIIYCWTSNKSDACDKINKEITIRKVPNKRYYRDQIASVFYKLWLTIDNPDVTILNFMYHGEEYLPKNRAYCYILHSPASQIPARYEYVKNILPRFNKLHIIAISKMVEDEARPYVGNTPMSLIYNGTDTDKFRPLDKIQRLNNKLKIISASAFEERKGLHLVIEALNGFERNDELEYDIYGGGDANYGYRLHDLISKYNLDNIVKLKGTASNISEILPQYDLFMLPSKGEAFALSPIEAMACGLPIIVSDCAPYPEFVKSSFGFMVSRGNPEEIRDAIRMLLDNPVKLEEMKTESRIIAQNYSWTSVVEKYLDVMTQIAR